MAEKRVIRPGGLVEPVGYSHGVLTSGGRLLFLAGQIGIDAEGRLVSAEVVGQLRQALANLRAVVEEAGGVMEDIASLTIYVQDRDGYKARLKELGGVHREFFGRYYPAAALVEVSRFFEEGVLVEVAGIAVVGESSGRRDQGSGIRA